MIFENFLPRILNNHQLCFIAKAKAKPRLICSQKCFPYLHQVWLLYWDSSFFFFIFLSVLLFTTGFKSGLKTPILKPLASCAVTYYSFNYNDTEIQSREYNLETFAAQFHSIRHFNAKEPPFNPNLTESDPYKVDRVRYKFSPCLVHIIDTKCLWKYKKLQSAKRKT